MSLGPIEVVVLGFPGNAFTGEIGPRIVDRLQCEIVTASTRPSSPRTRTARPGSWSSSSWSTPRGIVALNGLLSNRLDLLASEDASELATELRQPPTSPGRGESKVASLSHAGDPPHPPEVTMKVEPADTRSSPWKGLFTRAVSWRSAWRRSG